MESIKIVVGRHNQSHAADTSIHNTNDERQVSGTKTHWLKRLGAT